jgi:hypothetical protein
MQNPIITVIYSHGRHGSPWYGFKIEALRPVALKLGINMISIRYPEEMSVVEMEDKLFNVITDDVNVPGDLVFLSSSRGAYITTRISKKVSDLFNNEPIRYDDDKKLPKRHLLGQFLIAPAFYIKPDYYPDQNPTPVEGLKTTIIHGFDDPTIDCENSIKFSKLFKSYLFLVEGGHRLNSQREKLCLFFENFLHECIVTSDDFFKNWLKENPQPTTEPDDWK